MDEWILKKKFGSWGARGFRVLARKQILANADAYRAFEKHGIDEAQSYMDAHEPTISDQKFEVLGDAVSVLKKIQTEDTVYRPGSRRFAILKELDAELHKLLKSAATLKESA
jgi:hypothetical protein